MGTNQAVVNIKVEVIKTSEGLRSLQNDWDRLSINSKERSIYGKPKLLSIWWENFGQDRGRPMLLKRGFEVCGAVSSVDSLYVLVAYAEDEVVGILPLMLLDVYPQGGKKPHKCLVFLGDQIFAPTPTITFKNERRDEVFSALIKYLKISQDWETLFLAPVSGNFEDLKDFIAMIQKALNAECIYSPLYEIHFLRHWDKAKVQAQLKRLAQVVSKTERVEVNTLVHSLEILDAEEFSKKCLTDITPRLKSLLDKFNQGKGLSKGITLGIYNEILPEAPYVYKIIPLPRTLQEFEATLSPEKRHKVRKVMKLCKQASICITFESHLVDEDYNLFSEWHRNRYPYSVHFSALTMTYYSALLKQLSQDDSLLWIVGRGKDNAPVFFGLLFIDYPAGTLRGISYCKKEGIINFNLADICIMSAVEKGIDFGLTYLDLRMGAEEYKSRFHPIDIPVSCFIASRSANHITRLLPKQWVFKPS